MESNVVFSELFQCLIFNAICLWKHLLKSSKFRAKMEGKTMKKRVPETYQKRIKNRGTEHIFYKKYNKAKPLKSMKNHWFLMIFEVSPLYVVHKKRRKKVKNKMKKLSQKPPKSMKKVAQNGCRF